MAFGASSTAEEIVGGRDLSGKVVVVTGSSAGLGQETARVFAKAGATVVMAARNIEKNGRAADAIRTQVPNAKLELVTFDLADLGSVRRAAAEILTKHRKIDILINNAGFVGGPLAHTAEGCELHFGANHIGPFLLTNLLMPAVIAAAPSRVVILSSNGHRMADVDFEDPYFARRDYSHWTAYSQSKRANVHHAVALANRVGKLGVTVNAVHPGVIVTEVFRDVTPDEKNMVTGFSEAGGSPVKSIAQGAATQVWAALAAELEGKGGLYLEDCQVGKPDTAPMSATGLMPAALDPATAEKLWTFSEQVVGQKFAFG